MKSSPALQLLSLNLRDVIRIASDPKTPTAQATWARRDCQKLWQEMVREIRAMPWREDLRRSVEQSAALPPVNHYRPNDTPNGWRGHPGHWTGD